MIADLFHSRKPWESPETSGEGRLPMRSPLIPWPGAEEARAAAAAGPRGGAAASPWVLNLDGSWRFALAANPDAVPRGNGAGEGFASPRFDDSQWGELRVPGTWTLQGHDKPHYTNVVMPFGNVPPSAPASHNPTGLYRVSFELPAAWERRRVVLHVGGAESFLEAWCNGTRLGFSKDTRLPSEFDLTPFLRAGTNLLAFMVIRYSDASFIEDQDQWWYGGIYRSVYLYSTEFAYIADVDARPVLGDASAAPARLGRAGGQARLHLRPRTRRARRHRAGRLRGLRRPAAGRRGRGAARRLGRQGRPVRAAAALGRRLRCRPAAARSWPRPSPRWAPRIAPRAGRRGCRCRSRPLRPGATRTRPSTPWS